MKDEGCLSSVYYHWIAPRLVSKFFIAVFLSWVRIITLLLISDVHSFLFSLFFSEKEQNHDDVHSLKDGLKFMGNLGRDNRQGGKHFFGRKKMGRVLF